MRKFVDFAIVVGLVELVVVAPVVVVNYLNYDVLALAVVNIHDALIEIHLYDLLYDMLNNHG